MKIKNKINNHYNYLINKHGENKSGLGWRNNKLYKRYKVFYNHLNFKNKSVLDFGCGFCDLFFFLNRRVKLKDYVGFEINPKIIKIIKKNNKNIKTINKINSKEKFDITISNGVHNFNYQHNKKVIFNDLKKIFKIFILS